MNDADREERAIWQLGEGGYRVARLEGGRYLITSSNSADEVDDLKQLWDFAQAVYDRVWCGRKITPSA